MRVLVACENSGVVRDAFFDRGHDAYSCDVLPDESGRQFSRRATLAGFRTRHFHCDVAVIGTLGIHFDLLIAHPPCTYLCGSAAWAFSDGPYHQRVKPGTLVGARRRAARDDAIRFAESLFYAPWASRVAIENPVGALSTMSILEKADQYVQPYEFGDDASKKTGLWLRNLPTLKVDPAARVAGRIVNGRERWSNQTDSGQSNLGPSADRWQKRSKTYPGIAAAMADQWGRII